MGVKITEVVEVFKPGTGRVKVDPDQVEKFLKDGFQLVDDGSHDDAGTAEPTEDEANQIPNDLTQNDVNSGVETNEAAT